MAFSGSIAPRRKTTTYGKHSRTLISTPSLATEVEFAQDAGSNILDVKGTIRHWQSGSGSTISSLLHGHSEGTARSEKSTRRPMSTSARLGGQGRSSLSGSDAAKDVSLYELPRSDDDLEHNYNPSRKRRKFVTNNTVADKNSPVYDDESLQRHIAGEARQDGGASALQEPRSEHCAMESQAVVQWISKEGMSQASKNRTLGPKRRTIDGQAAEQTNGPLLARKRPKSLLKGKNMHHRAQGVRLDRIKTTERPMTSDTELERALLQGDTGDTRSFYTSSNPVYQPTTPRRRTGKAGEATTPRQRELWRRLLMDSPQERSPSSVDFLGRLISEERSEELHGYAKSHKASWKSYEPSATALIARPPRIIDTLLCSDECQDHVSYNADEQLGISSSDSRSDYFRSEVSAADGAITIQTPPSVDSQTLVSQYQPCSPNASQTIPVVHGEPLKITYARQRSYLTDNDLEEAALVGLPVTPEPKNRRGYQRRRLVDQVPNMQSMKEFSRDFEDRADSQGGTMRSIHELREAGGNVRLVGELETILDDISDHQSGSISFRRSRLIDLVTKLEEPANCRLFVDQGLENRLTAEVGLGDDLISHSLLVMALLQLMTFSSSTVLLTQFSDVRVVKLLIDLLGSDLDILSYARARGNMSKAAYADLKEFCSSFLKSTTWRVGKSSVLSCHVLSLQCLEHLVRQTREAGFMYKVLSAHSIRRIVATSVPHFSTLPPQPDEISMICLELAVSILESCTIGNAAESQASLWEGETLERVIGLLPMLALCKGEQCGTSRTLTLRLYLNLTNNCPSLCEDFSTPEVIGAMIRIVISHFEQLANNTLKTEKTLVLDDLILSLGSLINLADLSQIARQLVMDLCYEGRSYLDILLDLFMNKFKNAAEVSSLEETSFNVAFGWVSVLLGWLCLNPAIKARVIERLPGKRLKELLDAVEEFLRYHRRVDQVILQSDGEDDARVSFIGRLQNHVDGLKKAQGFPRTPNEIAKIDNAVCRDI